jgi:hypothetical protein
MMRALEAKAGGGLYGDAPGVGSPATPVMHVPNQWPLARGAPLSPSSDAAPLLDSLAISSRRPSLPSLSDHRSISGLSELSEASDTEHTYADLSCPVATRTILAAPGARPAPFLTKVQQILDWPQAAVAVRWATAVDGSPAFVIVDQATLAKEILPRFYKHNKISSFLQQLYTYGFRRADLSTPDLAAPPPSPDETDGSAAGRSFLAFQHPLFHPNRLDLLPHIKRAGPARPGSVDPSTAGLAFSEARLIEADASAVRELDVVEKTILALESAHRLKVAADERRIDLLWQMVQLRHKDKMAAEAHAQHRARVAAAQALAQHGARIAAAEAQAQHAANVAAAEAQHSARVASAWTAASANAADGSAEAARAISVGRGDAGWSERATCGVASAAAAGRRDSIPTGSPLPAASGIPVPSSSRRLAASAPPPGYTNLSDAGCQAGHGLERISPESISTVSVAQTHSVSADDDQVGADNSDSAESLSGSSHTDAASTAATDCYGRSDTSSMHEGSVRSEGRPRAKRESATDRSVGDKRSALQQSVSSSSPSGDSGDGEAQSDVPERERHRDSRPRLAAKGEPAGAEEHGAQTGDSRKRPTPQRTSSPHDSIEF